MHPIYSPSNKTGEKRPFSDDESGFGNRTQKQQRLEDSLTLLAPGAPSSWASYPSATNSPSNEGSPGSRSSHLAGSTMPSSSDMTDTDLPESMSWDTEPEGQPEAKEPNTTPHLGRVVTDDGQGQRDTCFGVVITTAVSSFKGRESSRDSPVTFAACGDMLRLSFEDTSRHAGLIKHAVLVKLLREFNVSLSGTLVSPQIKRKAPAKHESGFQIPQDCTARVVVHGLLVDAVAVGDMLGNSGLYLQHPSSSEMDMTCAYHNPHYLLRPGSQMPPLAQQSFGEESKKGDDGSLDEFRKRRFMRVFDEAHETSVDFLPEPSPRLRATLERHQLTALSRFMDTESGVICGPNTPSLWAPCQETDLEQGYRNRITGVFERSPRPLWGGILADEMGLGKTLSILALICQTLDATANDAKMAGSRSTLIVAPTIMITGWQQQCERHIQDGRLAIMTYHGPTRERLPAALQSYHIVLTTYETLRLDWEKQGPLYKNRWHRVVLDEAHRIRTRSSQIYEAACAVQARHRWCLTGTPIHNSLDDFGALLTFLGVPMFSSKSTFDFWITGPLKTNHTDSFRRLEILVKATCLRRTKERTNLSIQLPELRERTVWVDLGPQERTLYSFFEEKAAILASGRHKTQVEGSNICVGEDTNILSIINFLRQICDGGQALLPQKAIEAFRTGISGGLELSTDNEQPSQGASSTPSKINALIDHLQEAPEHRAKSVVFTSWKKMLDLTQKSLEAAGFTCQQLHGGMSLEERTRALTSFNDDPGCTVLLATTRSASEGVNLTAANHVYLLEPDWNPMVEAQAIGRVHRIGQSRPVCATRFLTKDSIETYVQWVQKKKLKIIQQSLNSQHIAPIDKNGEAWTLEGLQEYIKKSKDLREVQR